MFKKDKDTTATKPEKPVKEPKQKAPKPPKEPKQPKKKKDARGAKVEQELSELAKRLGIRVSSPYGYYPDDVDPIIENLETMVSRLTLENKKFSDELYESQEKCKSLSTELTKIKMQVSLMEVPDVSAEEGFAMLSRIDSITGNYNSESVVDMKNARMPQGMPNSTMPKPRLKITPKQPTGGK